MKKTISFLLVLCLLLPCAVICAGAVPAPLKCIAAGSVTDLFGTMWDNGNTDNIMEYVGDHTYSKTYTANTAYTNVQVRVYVDDDSLWYGDESGNAVAFDIEAPSDFTVSYNALTKVVSVSGDNIYDYNDPHDFESFYVFGNGDEGWLNNAADNEISNKNEMYEVADCIYCLRVNASAGNGREFRVSYFGSMEFTFGGSFDAYDVWTDAVFMGGPVTLDVGENVSELCIFLDLRDFDMATKEGARFAVVELSDNERFRLPKNTYKGEFDKDYLSLIGIHEREDYNPFYNELYCHTVNAEVDWVLVQATLGGPEEEWIIYSELGDRILHRFSGGNPFEYDYAVYDVNQKRFIGVENAYEKGTYTGLSEALDALNIGRLRGDIDKDNALTINDATEMQRCMAEFSNYPNDDLVYGQKLPCYSFDDPSPPIYISDVNQDGKRNIRDVTEIQRRLAGFK